MLPGKKESNKVVNRIRNWRHMLIFQYSLNFEVQDEVFLTCSTFLVDAIQFTIPYPQEHPSCIDHP